MSNKNFSKTGNSIWHQPYMDFLNKEFFPKIDISTINDEGKILLENYPKWIASSKLNSFTGVETFKNRYVTDGTIQSLAWWHHWTQVNGYNLKIFRGEFPYNRDAQINHSIEWSESIDDTGIQSGDAVLVSVPFSGTGGVPEQYHDIIKQCNEKDVPVLVDCAWFGTCYDIEINLVEPCIKMAVFSTTKGLSCGNWRIGVAFSNISEGTIPVQNEWNHLNHLNVAIGNKLMSEFSPDTHPNNYMSSQLAVCEHYGFEATNTVHIALAPKGSKWDEYHRDGLYNRVNIGKEVRQHKKKGKFSE